MPICLSANILLAIAYLLFAAGFFPHKAILQGLMVVDALRR
jgi:hypothetical protein